MIENQDELRKQLGRLNTSDKEKLKFFINELLKIQDKEYLEEDGIRTLENISYELDVFRANYMWRLIRILKQNHKLT